MKPSKEGKGDGTKQQQEKSGGTAENSDNPGALFPRLHVKETKNVGPRAPPRNKMALYEQLTVASHKFPQPSPQQHPTPAPGPAKIPPYLPQSFTGGYYLPYYMGPPMAFQAMNGGYHMLGQQPQPEWDQSELQRVPGISVADSTGHCHRTSASQSNTNSGKRKKARDGQEDFTVPTCFSTKAGSLFSKEQRVALEIPASTTAQESHLQSQASGFSAVMHNTSSEIRETSGTEKQSSSGMQSVRNFKGPDLQRCTSQTFKQNKGFGNAISSHSRSTIAVNNGSHVADHREFTPSKQQRAFHSPSSSFENDGDIDNQSDEEPAENSQLEEREASGDSETSMLDTLTAAKVTTKEIMNAIGDHEFWKMRKAMQRQQRLFHTQLFELHRLTKVQQLMASSGITDDDADSGNAAAKPEKLVEKRVERSKPSPPLSKAPKPAESPAYEHGSCPPVSPVMHGTNPGLGYAPYPGFAGVNQWYVGYAYPQNFAGPVATVGAFNSPYGPVFSGPGPMPFVPFPVPGYEQRPELRDPRYNVVAPPVQPWQASAVPNFVSGPGSQWMAYPRPFMIPSPSSQQPYLVTAGKSSHPAAAPAVPVIPSHAAQPPNAATTGSSPGFNLIQRAEVAQAGNPKTMEKQQVKLAGRRQGNAGAGCPRPYAFQPVDGERTQQNACEGGRGIKVMPKATMATPESAAGILQTIQQERL